MESPASAALLSVLCASGCAPLYADGASVDAAKPVVFAVRESSLGALQEHAWLKYNDSMNWCEAIKVDVRRQLTDIATRASKKKKWGILLTTVVGAAGSVTTAIVSSKQEPDANGKVDQTPTIVTGASTAGSTAIAGVVSTFFVGETDKQKTDDIGAVENEIEKASPAVEALCQKVLADNKPYAAKSADERAASDQAARACLAAASRLDARCTQLESRLPTNVNRPASIDPALATKLLQQK